MASKDFVRGFIELYRSYPCLWQTTNVNYNNRGIKNEAYDVLVEFAQSYFSEADKSFVQQRIQNLRTAFRKEFKKVTESTSTTQNVYVPRLWYYDLLLFTVGQDEISGTSHPDPEGSVNSCDVPIWTEGNLNEVQTTEWTENYDTQDEHDGKNDLILVNVSSPEQCVSPATACEIIQSSKYSKKIKRSKRRRRLDSSSSSKDEEVVDVYGALATVWTSKVRTLSEVQRVLAEDLINTVLKKAYFNELTKYTSIEDNVERTEELEMATLDRTENRRSARRSCKK